MFTTPILTIAYEAEPLAGGRAQLVRTVAIDGERIASLSHPVGSPAPIDTVRQHERVIALGGER